MKTQWVRASVGHYGVSSGWHWTNAVYPILHDVIHINDDATPA